MEELGVIVEIKNGKAIVRMQKSGGCEGCSASGSCKAVAGGQVLEAENPLGAKTGQHVMIKIESGMFLKASFLVYMLPVIFLFIGAIIGGKVGPGIYPGLSLDYWQAIVGILFLVLSGWIIRLFDRKVRGSAGMRPVITEIIDGCPGGSDEKSG